MAFLRNLREARDSAKGAAGRIAFEVAKNAAIVLAGIIGVKLFH